MEINFKDKTVSITSLHQWHTYEGLIEGVPHDKMNERILKFIPQKALKLTNDAKYILIEPEQTPIDIGREYPFGKPMSLPSFICVAGLRHHGTSKPEIGGISELTLICFQNQFTPPFESKVLEEIEKLNWFDFAKDISWDEY
ncbi:hypothetical protein [Aureispira sp. CCB-E]|uniref:hypothetical protein n=1 Tax=Aureispira sp. CCB-E TaxID=3051121 RepID=UPI002869772D|nr:hypothetical protein [Aureispira sp. CCB-E]WMX13161.1 hypothetical protein QP953_20165 [Aureispira sp. CCB-E]